MEANTAQKVKVAKFEDVIANVQQNGGKFVSNHPTVKNFLVVGGKTYAVTKVVANRVVAAGKSFGNEWNEAFTDAGLPKRSKKGGRKASTELKKTVNSSVSGYVQLPIAMYLGLTKGQQTVKGKTVTGYKTQEFTISYENDTKKPKSITLTISASKK